MLPLSLALTLHVDVTSLRLVAVSGCYDVITHLAYEKRRGVEQASTLAVACEPLAENSPTILVLEKGHRLACERVLLLHGERDVIVPPSNSACFAVALATTGRHVRYIPLPNDAHMTYFADLVLGRNCEVMRQVKQFCFNVPPTFSARL